MKKTIVLYFLLFIFSSSVFSQKKPIALDAGNAKRCVTMELMEKALKKNPALRDEWKAEGEKQYASWLRRKLLTRETEDANEIIIPIVFHIVDVAGKQASLTDRDIYEQVEILNQSFKGKKIETYKKVIPAEIYNRTGSANIKFVLAKRTPSGALTSGIERRVNTSPDHISVKSFAAGGLDAWDVNKYVNVWVGTFSGDDLDLLGIATFPFTTDEGPQGVVVGTAALPYTSNVQREYYPAYAEGATLTHEIGHYFYLFHTFGDNTICNNDDFRIEPGWNLQVGAGPEGDDTPEEKAGPDNAYFGNPSQNYSDGCTIAPYGMMYGSFMNYFDDRALFMFSNGQRKRVEGCIDLYRLGLKTSDGAIPPVAVTDAFLVSSTPRGYPDRRAHLINNTPLSVVVRNNGSGILNSIILNTQMDNNAATGSTFILNLEPGKDTVLQAGTIAGGAGTHLFTIFTSSPNGGNDRFPENDTIQSFIFITGNVVSAPFIESFTAATFPPTGWNIWNPQENTSWVRNATSGYQVAGVATVQNFSYKGGGQLDELNSPIIDIGGADSALLEFKVAYGVYDLVDVSIWDGLEVYISNDGGITYDMPYRKTGKYLMTVSAAQTSSFFALPSTPEKWRNEFINLTPYLKGGKKLLIKFRNINAYGNNLYLDDIEVSSYSSFTRDAFPKSIVNIPDYYCSANPTPSVIVGTNGNAALTSLKINYSIDNGNTVVSNWSGSLTPGNTVTVPLGALTNLSPGKHVFTVYTSLPNGSPDQFINNDTISKIFYIPGHVASPYTEGFETNVFPPSLSALHNPDGLLTWQKANIGFTGSGSAVIKNYDQQNPSTNDRFITPTITGNAAYDSVFVSFDYAYASGINPAGSDSEPLDTLEIQVTQDCGQTFKPVWKNWGLGLQTVAEPNPYKGISYIPQTNEWRNIKIPLFPYVGNSDFQVFFVAKSNQQNNLYIDNINIYGITVPPRLKKQGYLVYPSPFITQFIIRNYEAPADFQSAAVYNSAGQKVWEKLYNGLAQKEETVELGKLPAGMYLVKLNYKNKTVTERILKL